MARVENDMLKAGLQSGKNELIFDILVPLDFAQYHLVPNFPNHTRFRATEHLAKYPGRDIFRDPGVYLDSRLPDTEHYR